MRKSILLLSAIASLAAFASGPAVASEIVYHPVNPTFGGNPLNGSALLSQAQAQGEGVKSGSQGPDLSGLEAALSGIGTMTIVPPSGSSGGSGSGSGSSQTNGALRANSTAVRGIVP